MACQDLIADDFLADAGSVPGGLTKTGANDFVRKWLRVGRLFIFAAVSVNIHLLLLTLGYFLGNLDFRCQLWISRGQNERALKFFDQVARVAFFDFLSNYQFFEDNLAVNKTVFVAALGLFIILTDSYLIPQSLNPSLFWRKADSGPNRVTLNGYWALSGLWIFRVRYFLSYNFFLLYTVYWGKADWKLLLRYHSWLNKF